MANAIGYIRVYESSDGGSGDPAKTSWQFFVDKLPVTTQNEQMAKTVRLALITCSPVQVTFDAKNVLSQVRIQFDYTCETRRSLGCAPPHTKSER